MVANSPGYQTKPHAPGGVGGGVTTARGGGRRALLDELVRFRRMATTPRLRTLRWFAEQELVIPSGPHQGRFKTETQPYMRAWFDAHAVSEAMGWNRKVATGPAQSGKTLGFSVLPVKYHLFEHGEHVIFGLPMMDMAKDKWEQDIRPVIEASRYRELLPRSGSGSKGGTPTSIQFGNGAILRFMTAGGGDKQRSAYTSRVLVATEIDGYDTAGGQSVEADKLSQMEARLYAYTARLRQIYLECTVTTQQGRTWTEYQAGTASRLLLPCPHCHDHVAPEREHLVGWQDAPNDVEAMQGAAFCCPSCGSLWSDADRLSANRAGVLVHRGQSVGPDGQVVGDPPKTRTLGFRWSAVNNMLLETADVALLEYEAKKDEDEDNAERKLLMYTWAVPHESTVTDAVDLKADDVKSRTAKLPRGYLPEDTEHLTVGVDVGQRLLYWFAVAWSAGGGCHCPDYGRVEVPSDAMAVEKAIVLALRDLRDFLMAGFAVSGGGGKPLVPRQVWIDAGHLPDVVYSFCREQESVKRFRPAIGRGASQLGAGSYQKPRKKQGAVLHVGEEYHFVKLPAKRVLQIQVNADHWKTWLHQRLGTPAGEPGALSLYDGASKNEHLSLAKHLTAEREFQEFLPGKGTVTRWRKVHKNNHWLDAAYNACAAGHWCGFRLVGKGAEANGDDAQQAAA